MQIFYEVRGDRYGCKYTWVKIYTDIKHIRGKDRKEDIKEERIVGCWHLLLALIMIKNEII